MNSLNEKEQRYLEGYAAALQDILYKFTGGNSCSKRYDPMTCEATVIHSYAFNMKDGGRHHSVEHYESIEEIKNILISEVAREIHYDRILD